MKTGIIYGYPVPGKSIATNSRYRGKEVLGFCPKRAFFRYQRFSVFVSQSVQNTGFV